MFSGTISGLLGKQLDRDLSSPLTFDSLWDLIHGRGRRACRMALGEYRLWSAAVRLILIVLDVYP